MVRQREIHDWDQTALICSTLHNAHYEEKRSLEDFHPYKKAKRKSKPIKELKWIFDS